MYINVIELIVGDILLTFHTSAFKRPITVSYNFIVYIKLVVISFNGIDIVIGSNTHFVHVY